MLVDGSYEISSCDDIELGIKRSSPLSFYSCYDDAKDAKALLVIIPGLGEDSDLGYRANLIRTMAESYDVACISVDYHCIGNRPQLGAKFGLDDIDREILTRELSSIGINLPIDLKSIDCHEKVDLLLKFLSKEITIRKERDILPADFRLNASITMVPTKNEYQNFGVMQAMDVLNAVLYTKKYINNAKFEHLPVIMVGSSHGGYLAHMCAKIAPWLVDAVIDNSSYAIFLWRLIGFGKEINFTNYFCFGTDTLYQNLYIYFFDKTYWTLNEKSPYYFIDAREEIRNILNLDHLNVQSSYKKPIYVSYHCICDKEIAPAKDKIELYEALKKLKFDATLHMVKDESEVDGKFIKFLAHGMGMSYKLLLQKELPSMMEKILSQKNNKSSKSIEYKCGDTIYKFSEVLDQINLEILDIA
ncbi:DUF2920 family protein [Campylobacter concisus]|uniref:DUF2920 family protein n=1 Tax=Campylobacter concisus TaxID=199 RepID=UPI000CD9F8A5|nr:DUF2920 family protein [Campylobacter concisus]QPH87505.1 DUF2920 family protein [Campylobacter concisus]QPI02451.1 DUF2920 family protein [Campylobacter concisus]